jgi:hypothetical protein
MKPMPRNRQPRVGDPDYRHPYVKYEGTPMWNWLSKGIRDLVENLDLVEREEREFIVGYLCKVIARGQAREQGKKTTR